MRNTKTTPLQLLTSLISFQIILICHIHAFELTVFPLRKSCRFPTEHLTLNLYEHRYIQLAEKVLEQNDTDSNDHQYFGAFYCAGKPQIIPGGDAGISTPITPLVEVGDIGVVCRVLSHADNYVPIRDPNSDATRRRIRLQGVVVGRFRIDKVLQNGYSSSDAPFILVDATRVDDADLTMTASDDIAKTLYEYVLKRDPQKIGASGEEDDEEDNANMNSGVSTSDIGGNSKRGGEGNDWVLTADRFAPIMSIDGASGGESTQRKRLDDDYELKMEEALYDWASKVTTKQNTNDGADAPDPEQQRQKQRRVLFSFAMAAALLKDRPALELEGLIRKTSTHDRLSFIMDFVESRDSFWSTAVRNAINVLPLK